MTGISRYMARQLLIGTALVGVVLVFIIWLTQSLRFLQFVMNKGLPLGAWLKLTVYMLPGFVTLILPFGFFFVVLFVYNKLAMDKELVVVQAAGVSRAGLALPAVAVGGGLTILILFMNSFVVPATVSAFKELQWAIRTDISQVLLREGAFNTLGSGLTVYVRDRAPNGELLDLMVNDARKPGAAVTLLAARGAVRDGDDGRVVMLYNGSRQARGAADDLSVLYFDSYALDLGKLGGADAVRSPDNRERSTFQLLALDETDGFTAANVSRMRSEGHQRLAMPFNLIGYALVAVAWLLSGDFDRRGQWRRVGGAILCAVALQAAALGAMNATAKSAFLAPLMYMVALLPILGGAYILTRGAQKWWGGSMIELRKA